ncbi:MAG: polymorphic toxin-type HINT domain-containing protein, partial [Phycisphaerae bacterium]
HPGANIVYLEITGLDEPLGVTDTHPIWSETRQDFVVAGQLEIGEQFRTVTGQSATLTKIHPHRGPPEMVFNLEVDGQHVYHVASSGLLVHNACPISMDDALDRAHNFMEPGVPIRSVDGSTGVQFVQNYVD